jgi:ribosomal protein S18 acetylase RimI-like enzyme
VLEQAAGLSTGALEAIADLERRVLDAEGGRLKLEWGTLRGRSGDRVEDLLWWEGDRLLGFLGLYGYGPLLELAGMVAPEARRRGIATALLDAAMQLARVQGNREILLIVPRPSAAGKHLALARGGTLHHSEHALVLSRAPTGAPGDAAVALRPARPSDVSAIARLFEVGFGHPATDVADRLDRTLVIEFNGGTVGTMLVSRDGDDAGIYGFVIDPPWQGRGLGRHALRSVCERLRSEGVRDIRLEVEVDNDRALGLYTSIGFAPVTTEDYYALPALTERVDPAL